MLSKGKPPVATLEQVIRNQSISIQMLQLELSKSHIDEDIANQLLWKVSHANITIQGILRLGGVI